MKVWIYLDGRQQGPFELEELLDMPVTENTKVWFEGLPKWYPAGYLAEMRPLFDGSLMRAVEVPETPEVPEPPTPPLPPPAPASVAPEGEPNPAPGMFNAPAATPVQPCPPSYLVWGIVLTICCCSPLAIGVIIASICVGNYYARGEYGKAETASRWAQWLIMATLAFGFIPIAMMMILL